MAGVEEREGVEGREEGEGRNLVDRSWAHYTGEITSSAYSKRKQVLATLCATLGCLLNGAVIGYSSPALPSLLPPHNTTDLWGGSTTLDLQECSWVASLLSVGCFLGCLLAGPVMERIGRKRTLMLVSSASYAIGFLAILTARSALLINLGRFMNGVGLGLVIATVSVYIVEIATADMRGFLGCFVQFLGSVGVLLSFCLGAVLSWWELACAHLALVVPFVLAMTVVPESPHWLLMRGNEWAGEQALKWLRGRGPEAIDREIEMIKKELRIRKRERQSITLLLEPEILKPFAIALAMMFFLQFSGFNVMVFYCGLIFQEVGGSVAPHTASMVVAAVLLLSCFVALAVVSQLPRKPMLVLSILGMAASQAALGACFYVKEGAGVVANSTGEEVRLEEVAEELPGWLPLVAVSSFLFLGNVGYGTLIWVVTAELLPPKVRAVINLNSLEMFTLRVTGLLHEHFFPCSSAHIWGWVVSAFGLWLSFVLQTSDKPHARGFTAVLGVQKSSNAVVLQC